MMNVMKTDVPGKPLEQPGQFVIGAAADRSHEVRPFIFGFFVIIWLLVLNVEKPEGNHAKKQDDGAGYHQHGEPAQ